MKLRLGRMNGVSAGLMVGLLVLSCLMGAGCTDRKGLQGEVTEQSDSVVGDTLPADTMPDIVEDAPLPKAACMAEAPSMTSGR